MSHANNFNRCVATGTGTGREEAIIDYPRRHMITQLNSHIIIEATEAVLESHGQSLTEKNSIWTYVTNKTYKSYEDTG